MPPVEALCSTINPKCIKFSEILDFLVLHNVSQARWGLYAIKRWRICLSLDFQLIAPYMHDTDLVAYYDKWH